MNPSFDNNPQSGAVPPPVLPEAKHKAESARQMFAVLLSLCLALFLADAVISLADDSLILLGGFRTLSAVRGLTGLFALLMSAGVYCLIGLTPMIPKRLFLPISLFPFVMMFAVLPFAIYCFDHLPLVAWSISAAQVVVGLGVLYLAQGRLAFRWPLVPAGWIGTRGFSWRNSTLFVLTNVFVLLPAVMVYSFLCAALAVNHFSGGFMALHPNGFSVQARKYVRDDGKMIELFPMSHIADAQFYWQISQTFPTNSIILMEGVTDEHNLLTNKITYRRAAKSLGLAEQHEKFEPTRGKIVPADLDVDQFSQGTIDTLNLVMLIHAKGLTPGDFEKLMRYSTPNDFTKEFFGDLVQKRNQHLVQEIQSHLSQTEHIVVPWGVAHMPGIANEIQKSGFRLDSTQEYMVIQFGGNRHQGNQAEP